MGLTDCKESGHCQGKRKGLFRLLCAIGKGKDAVERFLFYAKTSKKEKKRGDLKSSGGFTGQTRKGGRSVDILGGDG